jgi:hypothetical protein
MGKRGPQPQSAELKKLRGNPGKRAIPETASSTPMVHECPDDLADIKSTWDYYGNLLAKMGILQDSDAIAWDALWRTWKKYKELALRREVLDELVEIASNDPNKEASTIKSLFTLIAKIEPLELQYLQALTRQLDHFGMSPSSRGSIAIDPPKEESEFERFMKRDKVAK